jgi:hypothetical protein
MPIIENFQSKGGTLKNSSNQQQVYNQRLLFSLFSLLYIFYLFFMAIQHVQLNTSSKLSRLFRFLILSL